MNLINQPAFDRGRFLINYAFSDRDAETGLAVADLVGITAAYLARGGYSGDMEDKLSALLSPSIARAASRTFDFFDDADGRGLWTQGPAMEDIVFTHNKLNRFHPQVAVRQSGMIRASSVGSKADEPF